MACAGVLTAPLLELIRAADQVVQSTCVFLGASVPVYSALLVASGNQAVGGGYSFFNIGLLAVPSRCSLRLFLCRCCTVFSCWHWPHPSVGENSTPCFSSLYSFGKWALVLAVTLFSGILSVQTVLNAQVDAATGKTVKLLASSAIPIVGGAFGDAVTAIQNSVRIVKSGVGAFGFWLPSASLPPLHWRLPCGWGCASWEKWLPTC